MTTARHHHYLSQCYLKGFTKNGSKKSKLTVIDFKEKKRFETIPRNVGGIRDFNRIEIEGVDPNTIETSLSDFEGKVATAFKRVEENLKLDGENKDYILTLVALLSARSPEMRENWRGFNAKIMEMIMDMSLETKERWESQMTEMEANGYELKGSITYDDIKKFHESKAYTIKFSTAYHIDMEIKCVEAILPCLYNRAWLLIQATKESGNFITTDNPVNLTWSEPDKIPPFYRNSPGFGLKNTHVYFPLSRNLALLGEFDGRDGLLTGTKELVATLNSKMLALTYKQIYASSLGFHFLGSDAKIFDGTQILKHINS